MNETSVFCSECCDLVNGIHAGSHVRWTICDYCSPPTSSLYTYVDRKSLELEKE